MKLQLPHLLAFAATVALTSAAPSVEIEIKQGYNPQSQKSLHGLDGDVTIMCQPQDAFCMETPFHLGCCQGLECTSDTGGKCGLPTNTRLKKEVSAFDGDVHATCRAEGEFCQLVPLAMACCGNLRCSNIFGGNCEEY